MAWYQARTSDRRWSDDVPIVGMGSLDDYVVHLPSGEHGVSRCGERMRDPWRCGPWIAFEYWEVCDVCVERW